MTTLIVTARGRITFPKEVLRHLGIQPGQKIQLELLPDGRAELKAVPPKGEVRSLHGLLKGKTNGKVLSFDDLDDANAQAGADAGAGRR